jgi:membrane protein
MRHAAFGAVCTALLLNVGKSAIGLYLGRSGLTTPFGAAGSLALLLLWVYYAAQVLFLGAAFTRVYSMEAGETLKPNPYAEAVETVPVDGDAVKQQHQRPRSKSQGGKQVRVSDRVNRNLH